MSEDSGWQVPSDAPRHYEEQVLRFMKPFAEALVDAVVRPGGSTLDVACGTGIATRIAAATVGPGVSVVGSDINRPMLDFAANVSAIDGDDITWREASAMDLPFGDAEFESVICQQGVQFFPDPSRGLREMIRVTAPGGAVGFTVWSPLADSPYFEAMHSMLSRYCDAESGDLGWSADDVLIDRWLDEAGVIERASSRHVATVELPPLHTFVPAHMKATPWAETFSKLSPEEASTAISEMQDHISQSAAAGKDGIDFSSFLVTARP
jgi:ubiquinone/menaquinone biosynthesis C-methylase UbiE